MKKLMIALAAVAFAAVSQAAVVNWSTGRIKAPGEDGTGWSDTGISGSGYAATVYFWASSTDAGDISKALDITGDSSSTISSGQLKGTASTFDSGTYYTQVVVTKGDSTLTSQIGMFTVNTASLNPDVDVTFYSGAGITDMSGNAFPSGTGKRGAYTDAGWQTVPEPTSGLLLLLGVAGLALRRRRA